MSKFPTLEEMLEAGVHFGHRESKAHPKMRSFVFSVSNGVQIINLEKTQAKLKEALDFIAENVRQNKRILLIGTKYQAKNIIKEAAEKAKISYVTERWIGGTLTNFPVISKMASKLKKLERDLERGEFEKYTKKEQARFKEEISQLQNSVGGLRDLEKMPDMLFIVDVKREQTAFNEARKMNIPVIAIADTNVNPDKIDFPIPANDDGLKSLKLIIETVVSAASKVADQVTAAKQTSEEK